MSYIGNPRKGFNVMAYNRQKFDRAKRRQMSVEFLGNSGPDDWQAVHTGLSDLNDAMGIAERLYRGLTDKPGPLKTANIRQVRVCETPFGKVLATVSADGKCVALPVE
jgi:hypothetical protein